MKRNDVAAALMALGVLLISVGVGLAFGIAFSLIAAGVAACGVAVLLGWR
ncbi:hypothetical protein [Luteipulveratus mongoliensis]|nr:hypothetical protein [Luteipulveratus mongoliensis]